MLQGNQTTITEFIIVGFPGLHPEYNGLVSTVFFLIYVTTVTGNSFLVVLFAIERSLHKPMYIIMLSLALSDIGFCTVALPKIIAKYWFNADTILFNVCFMQNLLIHYFGTLDSFIMMIMALDRYIAICYPLRYPMLITNKLMVILNASAWVLCMVPPTTATMLTYKLPFCGPNKIIQCYCDTISIQNLACANYDMQRFAAVSIALIVLLLPLSFIIYSYAHIIVSVLRVASAQGRWKTFSTCSAQLCIIALFYVPRCFVYLATTLNFYISTDFRIVLTLFYSLFPPLVNPFIYCLRTREIRKTLSKWSQQKKIVSHQTVIAPVST
ncbi:olfactory receptor 1-like [Megalops cyprinoides]|uniref:olfactory receptor 1-like n=1 Tax=Megalops cyprinoides TaxID=118141 RepID=UPI0018656BCB|nr:olfactory receptor 1-like [Megalops cyprinoides]